MNNDLIDVFVSKWLDFSLQIRERQGVNEELYQDLMDLLERIGLDLEGKDHIPKGLAEIFLDMWGAMTCCAELYDSRGSDRIYLAADHLAQQARVVCTN
ncbi:hypothetical protein [Pseudomonas entomophila]|uniref:hypothetical protein n=1 Tax=Pseudomonas entomophila TaxID=312306 RepID=UPI00200CBAE8|nr:hypothetical protein [Pseudomonas entomophila]